MPQYDELTLDEILDFGLSYKDVVDALPIMREIRKMPREYICNVIYTLVGEEFKKWMMERCQERNKRLETVHNTGIKLDKRTFEAFQASKNISQSNGTGAHL